MCARKGERVAHSWIGIDAVGVDGVHSERLVSNNMLPHVSANGCWVGVGVRAACLYAIVSGKMAQFV